MGEETCPVSGGFVFLTLPLPAASGVGKPHREQLKAQGTRYRACVSWQQTADSGQQKDILYRIIASYPMSFQIRNCPADSHPSCGFPVSQSAIRNYLPMLYALCLAPYALRLAPLQPVKLVNSDLARTTRFSWLNKLSLKNLVEK
jgi:hypothetical protein